MSRPPLIAVLDYGIGNLRSAEKALQRCGADARLTVDHGLIAEADAVVLPGVGAFGACMAALREADLEDAVEDAVDSGRPFLGICVGMQMLFDAQRGGRRRCRARHHSGQHSLARVGAAATADAMEPADPHPTRRSDVCRPVVGGLGVLRALVVRRPG